MRIMVLLTFLIFTEIISAQNLKYLEYFFNGDPGYGNGNSLPVSQQPDQHLSFVASLANVPDGFNSFTLRALDDSGHWSHLYTNQIFKETITPGNIPNFSGLEYFLNNDPGYGNGISVPVNPLPDQAISFVADITKMPIGFNRLTLRTSDANGKWSMLNTNMFYKETANINNLPQLTRLEYFLNDDPGYGNGTSVPISSATDQAILFVANITNMPTGFNRLTLRALDANGKWSMLSTNMFYKETANILGLPQLTRLEYFLNDDPGYGNGTSVPISSASDQAVSFVANITNMPTGFNRLTLRALDANGKWSMLSTNMFYKETANINSIPQLTRLEYYLNNDPGYGNGTSVAISSVSDQSVSFVANITNMPTGFNRMTVRALDANGKWSMLYTSMFYKESAAINSLPQLTRLEYFLNDDPGYGNGTAVQVSPASEQAVFFVSDISKVPSGFNRISIRGLDSYGHWSSLATQIIFKEEKDHIKIPSLVKSEYFIDTDPGEGKATPIAINSGTDQTLLFKFDVSLLTPGVHTLVIRALDSNGVWSMINNKTFFKNNAAWMNSMSIADQSGDIRFLSFGQDADASDGIDASVGEFPPADIPGAGIFSAGFCQPDAPGKSMLTDIRNTTADTVFWHVAFQPRLDAYPMTLNWEQQSLPDGQMHLRSANGLVNVDMKGNSTYIVTDTTNASLDIAYIKQTCASLMVNKGWNLISVPLALDNFSLAGLFPSAESDAFSYANGYVNTQILAGGKGYWLQFPEKNSFSLCGKYTNNNSITVSAGWNLIGVPNSDIYTSAVITTPDNILSSSFFGYNNGAYSQASVLKAGRGYWIKAAASGVLNFSNARKKIRTNPIAEQSTMNFPAKLTFTDATGQVAVLYLSEETISSGNYELPPIPPAGAFDIRFCSNRTAEDLVSLKQIRLSSVNFPVEISVDGIELKMTDAASGKLLNTVLKSGASVLLKDQNITTLNVEKNEIPKSFALSQNYPNPFNPTTAIRYAIPVDAKVTLTIYNIIGERVAVLVNEIQSAGNKTVSFNALSIPSGVYFYKLEGKPVSGGNTFVQSKKMVLLK